MMNNLQRIIWLASYPKSGNTWMRSLLAHYFMPKGTAPDINNLRNFTTADVRRDFYEAASNGVYNPKGPEDWIKVRRRALQLIAASKPDHHFVKTHCQITHFLNEELIPPEVTAAGIYIMRNPFDLAPSFARHQMVDIDTAIEKMTDPATVTGAQNGVYDALGRWDAHVDSWVHANGLPLHVIRYEDMLAKPAPTVRGMLEKFLKVKTDKPKLAYAIKATSFESMKKQEENLGFVERPTGMQSFFTKGKSGVWKEDLSQAQVARIREEFLPTLEEWYPELLAETGNFAG